MGIDKFAKLLPSAIPEMVELVRPALFTVPARVTAPVAPTLGVSPDTLVLKEDTPIEVGPVGPVGPVYP